MATCLCTFSFHSFINSPCFWLQFALVLCSFLAQIHQISLTFPVFEIHRIESWLVHVSITRVYYRLVHVSIPTSIPCANPLTKNVDGWPLWTPPNISGWREDDAWGDWFKVMAWAWGESCDSSDNYWLVMAKQGWQMTLRSTMISLYIAISTSFILSNVGR